MCDKVRQSVQFIQNNADVVTVNQVKLKSVILPLLDKIEIETFDKNIHTAPVDVEQRLRYILAVDALNFCFWPVEGFEYEHLTCGLTQLVKENPTALEPENLRHIDEQLLSKYLVYQNKVIDNIEERTRLLREVGEVLYTKYDGSALKFIESVGKNANELVELVAKEFSGFRDSTIYKSKQVFFYKRAQIVVGDIHGMCGDIQNLSSLTGFADYRIPQVLLGWDVLNITDELRSKIMNKVEIPSGSNEEIELRCTVLSAIQMIQNIFKEVKKIDIEAYRIDWFLWSYGEKRKDELPPHHRTRTIFY
ncbi:Queuosine 5'-phosphate N-glycosylase/hydrolase [Entamoeba marina]